MTLSPLMRNIHRFAIGIQLALMALFLWVYSVMHAPAWLVLAGWSAFYGALSYTALAQDRKARKATKGVEV